MENRFKQIAVFIFIILAVLSCDQFEMRGFVTSYESADQRFKQSMDWNARNPIREMSVPEDDYSIFVMSDSHIGGTKNLDIFLEKADETNAAAAVMVGDITMGYAKDFEILQQHLQEYDDLQSFLMVGNHDLYFDGWKKFYSLFGSTTYEFFINTPNATDIFICLDTGSGTLGSEQLDWLKEVLVSERKKYRRCVLFTHNNFFRIRHTTSGNPFVEELQVLLELSVKHEIDMVVAGHDHKRNVKAFGNTTFVTMDQLQDESKNAGYFKLSIVNGTIEYEFINL